MALDLELAIGGCVNNAPVEVVGKGQRDGDRLHLGAYCGSSSSHKAGALIQELAPLAGGKGGGKPDLARGAAPQRDKKDELLAAAQAKLG